MVLHGGAAGRGARDQVVDLRLHLGVVGDQAEVPAPGRQEGEGLLVVQLITAQLAARRVGEGGDVEHFGAVEAGRQQGHRQAGLVERPRLADGLDVAVDIFLEQAQANESLVLEVVLERGVHGLGAERRQGRVAGVDRQRAGGGHGAARVQVAQRRTRHHLGAGQAHQEVRRHVGGHVERP